MQAAVFVGVGGPCIRDEPDTTGGDGDLVLFGTGLFSEQWRAVAVKVDPEMLAGPIDQVAYIAGGGAKDYVIAEDEFAALVRSAGDVG